MVHVNVKSFCIIYKLYFGFYILTLDSNAGLVILNFCASLQLLSTLRLFAVSSFAKPLFVLCHSCFCWQSRAEQMKPAFATSITPEWIAKCLAKGFIIKTENWNKTCLIQCWVVSLSCDVGRSRHSGLSQACTLGTFAVRIDHIGLVPHEMRISFPIWTALAHANVPIEAIFPEKCGFCPGVMAIVPQYWLLMFSSGFLDTSVEVYPPLK